MAAVATNIKSALLKTLEVAQLVKQLPYIKLPECSLQLPQQSFIGPIRKPDESNLQTPRPL
jgi:hypothetical protein